MVRLGGWVHLVLVLDNINTTMIYVNVDEEEVKLNYQKYIK